MSDGFCEDCEGTGRDPDFMGDECPHCGGTGSPMVEMCSTCEGCGFFEDDLDCRHECPDCGGSGRI